MDESPEEYAAAAVEEIAAGDIEDQGRTQVGSGANVFTAQDVTGVARFISDVDTVMDMLDDGVLTTPSRSSTTPAARSPRRSWRASTRPRGEPVLADYPYLDETTELDLVNRLMTAKHPKYVHVSRGTNEIRMRRAQ